jgi:hypothetical protein
MDEYPRRLMILALKKHADEEKKVPIKKININIVEAIQKKYGTWHIGIKKLGFKPDPLDKEVITKEEIKKKKKTASKKQHNVNKKLGKSEALSLLGNKLEEIIYNILKDLNLNFEYQKEIGGVVPDYILENGNILDSKLSYNNEIAVKAVKKYSEHSTDLISIVYLMGEEVEEKKKSKYPHYKIHVNKLIERLPEKLQFNYYEEINDLKNLHYKIFLNQ